MNSPSDRFGEIEGELVRRLRIKFLGGDRRKGEFTVDPLAELCSCLFAVIAE